MLGNAVYSPFLFSRIAEIKALRELPEATKDSLFPIISCRPWPNANQLELLWQKIDEALGDRRFGLDLDVLKFQSESTKDAANQFDLLFDPSNGYENYYSLINDITPAVPILRLNAEGLDQFDRQLRHIEALQKGGILRINRETVQDPIALIDIVSDYLNDNFLVLLDAGWSNDLISKQAWFAPIIEKITDYSPENEIVVSGSSFPDSFTKVGTRGYLPVNERVLYENLVRKHNAAQLIYGDWGSTRTPAIEAIPMTNVPRIDLAQNRNWLCFRAENSSTENYFQIAGRAINDSEFPDDLDIWGIYMINCTAEESPVCIRSPSTAAAVRINLHMFHQAHYGSANPVGEIDEEYDDI